MNTMMDDFDIEIVYELTESPSGMLQDKIYDGPESAMVTESEVIYAR